MLELKPLKNGRGYVLGPPRERELLGLLILCGGLFGSSLLAALYFNESKSRAISSSGLMLVLTFALCLSVIAYGAWLVFFQLRFYVLLETSKLIRQSSPFRRQAWDFSEFAELEYFAGDTGALETSAHFVFKNGQRMLFMHGAPWRLGPLTLELKKQMKLAKEPPPEQAPGPGLPVRGDLNIQPATAAEQAATPLPPLASSAQPQDLPLD